MRGLWVFGFNIGSSSFDDTYAVADTGTVNGQPLAYGLDEFGDVVVVTYADGVYVLFDQGFSIDHWYFFTLDASGSEAAGCYYQGVDGVITSDCYTAAGGKVLVDSKRADPFCRAAILRPRSWHSVVAFMRTLSPRAPDNACSNHR